MLDALKYSGADKLAGVGDVYQDRAQAERDFKIKQFEAKQARPWEQLARTNAIASGAGQLGGTKVGTGSGSKESSGLEMTSGILGVIGKLFGKK
jgi:hypothetical protein